MLDTIPPKPRTILDIPSRSPSRLGLHRPPLQRCYSYIDNTVEGDDDELPSDLLTSSIPATLKARDSGNCDSSSDEEDEDFGSQTVHIHFLNTVPAFPSNDCSPEDVQNDLLSGSSTSCDDFFFGASSIPDHGHSYSALRLLKKMWSTRQDEWESWRYQTDALKSAVTVYVGIATTQESSANDHSGRPPSPQPGFSATSSLLPRLSLKSPIHVTDSEAPIYPRFGDISRIRDLSWVTMDRAFCSIPVHTIRKAFYFNDMVIRVGIRKDNMVYGHENGSSDRLVDSSSWKDENDTTLVDSESSPYLFSKVETKCHGVSGLPREDLLNLQMEFLENLRKSSYRPSTHGGTEQGDDYCALVNYIQ